MICTDFRNVVECNPFVATTAERAAVRTHYRACIVCREWLDTRITMASEGRPPAEVALSHFVSSAAAARLLAHDAADPEAHIE